MAVAVLLCNYTESEQKAWKFLLRGQPGIQLIPVEKAQYGRTLKELLEGPGEKPGPDFSDHLAVFCGAQGILLSHLIDVSGQVYRGKGYKAMLTEHNRDWTPPALLKELQAEEAQLRMRMKK